MFETLRPCASVTIAICGLLFTACLATAAEAPQFPLIPVDGKAVAERVKELIEKAPESARLVAYLDCGCQNETDKGWPVAVRKLRGNAYAFRADDAKVPATQPTIFFDDDRLIFELSGIDRTAHYRVGLTWWDFDAGGRTQSVMVSSADRRNVRIAVPAVGLPNYIKSNKLPDQKEFSLPATFAKGGKMQIAVLQVAGPNAVISELWIWQLEK